MEFDGLLQLIDLGSDLLSFSQVDGETVHLNQSIAQKFGDLLSDRVAGQQDVVLLGPFFDFVLVLIEGLESFDIDVGDVVGGGFFDMGGIGEDANLSDD